MKTIEEGAMMSCIRREHESDYMDGFRAGVTFAQSWISVDEELPEAYTWILCKCILGDYYISCANAKGEIITQKGETITHWRPINLE